MKLYAVIKEKDYLRTCMTMQRLLRSHVLTRFKTIIMHVQLTQRSMMGQLSSSGCEGASLSKSLLPGTFRVVMVAPYYISEICIFSVSVDVFDKGVWPMLKEIADPELLRLAKKLLLTVFQNWASSSCKKYIGVFKH